MLDIQITYNRASCLENILAQISCALETGRSPYLWILCDDDQLFLKHPS